MQGKGGGGAAALALLGLHQVQAADTSARASRSWPRAKMAGGAIAVT
jgi:hypothetical protein